MSIGETGEIQGEKHPLWDQFRSYDFDDFDEPSSTAYVLYQIPEFIEDEDRKLFRAIYHDTIRNTLLGTALGIAANTQLKRIPNFSRWNRFLRFGLRIPTFFLPFGFSLIKTRDRLSDLWTPLNKYQRRFLNFQKSGDAKYLDPEKTLARRWSQQNSLEKNSEKGV